MSNYLDVYHSRINHMGETTAERIRNGGIRSFYKWMAESPHTVRHLSVERGLYFDGIILTNKDKEYEKIMFLNVANNIPLKVGDIMNWTLDDRSIEKWIIVQEEKKVNGTYRTFWIIRCNYLLKWIDNDGHLQQSWAYVVSSVDSKIKGNYRTWNALITPQPNKYAEILMPYYPIDRATNFIVQDESWHTIECDFTSVPGTIYISLTENKVNIIYDDLENDIADIDKHAVYSVAVPPTVEVFAVGTSVEPTFSIVKNGQPVKLSDLHYEIRSMNEDIIAVENGELQAKHEGEAQLYIYFPDLPNSEDQKNSLTFTVQVTNETAQISYYIEGPEKIRLDRNSTYYLKPDTTFTSDNVPEWTLEDVTNDNGVVVVAANELAKLEVAYKRDENNEIIYIEDSNGKMVPQINYSAIIVNANAKNKLYKCLLKCTLNNELLASQIIQIVPIW